MQKLREMLVKEQAELERIIEKTRRSLDKAPEGKIIIGNSNGCVQYLIKNQGKKEAPKYLSKKEHNLATMLAQKSYDEKILRLAAKRHGQISRILKDYQNDEIEQVYKNQHIERQKLLVPVEVTYQQCLNEWMARPYTGKGFAEDAPLILTNKGLRVRSKSEKIMADYFDSMGIPYKYECPLLLEPYGIIYPDFTFLSRWTREEVYWEHEGMMDNPEYARAAVKKIELYETNGIYPGDNLILTFESSVSVINTGILKEMTKRFLL